MTSLTMVGFGDMVPITDQERVLTCIMLLFGVAIYSKVSDMLISMVSKITNFNGGFKERTLLDQFIQVL